MANRKEPYCACGFRGRNHEHAHDVRPARHPAVADVKAALEKLKVACSIEAINQNRDVGSAIWRLERALNTMKGGSNLWSLK